MKVLQLGPLDWSRICKIPETLEWDYNHLSANQDQHYHLVLITGINPLTDQQWKDLQWQVDPYCVCYMPGVVNHLSLACRYFIKCNAGQKITEYPQEFINKIPTRYFFGQSGIRIMPTNLTPMMQLMDSYQVLNRGHIAITIDTHNQWLNIGSYRQLIYLDPNRVIKFWLEERVKGILQVRLRFFIQPSGLDGDPNHSFTLNVTDNLKELVLPLKPQKKIYFANVSIEVRGSGELILGVLHSRWDRAGAGEFIAGGQRIVNPQTREEIAYHFNPGDLKPPLNVYFSGARSLEGFEGFPLFRSLHTPTLLFTDTRLNIGQFYTTNFMEKQIKQVIINKLIELGFTKEQLIINGVSMGSYPALKLGAELGSYAIIIAKPVANLGLIAKRGRLERSDAFDTIYDIDAQLLAKPANATRLEQLDQEFWQQFSQNDLSQTRLFVSYMQDDDYDNQAIAKLKRSPAIRNSRQFVTKGFPGRHNDNPAVINWFIKRLKQMLYNDFGRRE